MWLRDACVKDSAGWAESVHRKAWQRKAGEVRGVAGERGDDQGANRGADSEDEGTGCGVRKVRAQTRTRAPARAWLDGRCGGGDEVILHLPFPDKALFPNAKLRGGGWGNAIAPKAKATEDAYYITKQAMGDWRPQDGAVPLSIVFCQPDKGSRELDGRLVADK